MKATAKGLRFNSKGLIDAAGRGEEVVITFRGKPCAKLVPYGGEDGQHTTEELFGMWKNNEKIRDVDAYVRGLREGRF